MLGLNPAIICRVVALQLLRDMQVSRLSPCSFTKLFGPQYFFPLKAFSNNHSLITPDTVGCKKHKSIVVSDTLFELMNLPGLNTIKSFVLHILVLTSVINTSSNAQIYNQYCDVMSLHTIFRLVYFQIMGVLIFWLLSAYQVVLRLI